MSSGSNVQQFSTLSDPFASEANTSIDEKYLKNEAPSLPDTKVQDLIGATSEYKWNKQEGVNEKFLFDKRVIQIASTISSQLGPFALNDYAQSQRILEAATLKLTNEGNRTGSFRGVNAEGSSQWNIQQVTPASFSGSASDRVYSTGTQGNFDIIPGFGGTAGTNTESLNSDTQYAIFLGYSASTNPRAIDQVQLGVDDGSNRGAQDVYVHENLGTLQAFNNGSTEFLTYDDNFDLNGTAVQNTNTDFFPYGINLDTAANLPSAGVQQ